MIHKHAHLITSTDQPPSVWVGNTRFEMNRTQTEDLCFNLRKQHKTMADKLSQLDRNLNNIETYLQSIKV